MAERSVGGLLPEVGKSFDGRGAHRRSQNAKEQDKGRREYLGQGTGAAQVKITLLFLRGHKLAHKIKSGFSLTMTHILFLVTSFYRRVSMRPTTTRMLLPPMLCAVSRQVDWRVLL